MRKAEAGLNNSKPANFSLLHCAIGCRYRARKHPNAPMPPQLCGAIEITHYVSQTRAIKFEPSFFSGQVERLGTDKLSRQPRLRSRKRAVSCSPRIQYRSLPAGRERGGSLL